MLLRFNHRALMGPVFLLALSVSSAPPASAATFDLPSIDRIVKYTPKLPLQIFTADGVEIAQFGTERRIYVPLAKTPKCCRTPCWRWKTRAFASTPVSTPKAWRVRWWRP